MEYLADTVAIIRHFSEIGKIGKKANSIMKNTDSGKNKIWISIISLVEIMYLSERNKIPVNIFDCKEKIELSNNYQIVDLDIEIVVMANKITNLELHDRLIVATAKYLDIPILTCDNEIINSEIIEVLWN